MKLRHVFSVVIGAHLAVIALLFVTPGCQSGSGGADGAQDNSGGLTASDTAPQYARHARQWQTGPVYTPDSSPASNQLYSPTKPEWNVNENTSAAPVTSSYNDETIEVLQPVRGGAASGQPAAFGELVSITTETGGVDPYAGAGAGSSYTVQKGDSLTRIAARQGVSLSALMAANGLTRETANSIRVGQKLTIPAGSSAPAGGSQAGSAAPANAGSAASGDVYTVVSGDTLGGIAARHGTSVAALRSANNISGDTIRVGQKLRLPSGVAAQSGGNNAAPSRSAQPAANAPVAAANFGEGGEYQVRSGDTLGGIAARHGTTVQALMEANGISDPRRLRAGQKLKVPAQGTASASQSAPVQRSSSATGSQGASQTGTAPAPQFVAPEPVPTIPSTPGSSFGGQQGSGSVSGQGSGDDLLGDLDNIPTVN